MRYPLRFIYLH